MLTTLLTAMVLLTFAPIERWKVIPLAVVREKVMSFIVPGATQKKYSFPFSKEPVKVTLLDPLLETTTAAGASDAASTVIVPERYASTLEIVMEVIGPA